MVALVDAMDQLGIVFEKRANLRNADRLREMSRIYKTKGKVASFREVTDILHQLWQDKGEVEPSQIWGFEKKGVS